MLARRQAAANEIPNAEDRRLAQEHLNAVAAVARQAFAAVPAEIPALVQQQIRDEAAFADGRPMVLVVPDGLDAVTLQTIKASAKGVPIITSQQFEVFEKEAAAAREQAPQSIADSVPQILQPRQPFIPKEEVAQRLFQLLSSVAALLVPLGVKFHWITPRAGKFLQPIFSVLPFASMLAKIFKSKKLENGVPKVMTQPKPFAITTKWRAIGIGSGLVIAFALFHIPFTLFAIGAAFAKINALLSIVDFAIGMVRYIRNDQGKLTVGYTDIPALVAQMDNLQLQRRRAQDLQAQLKKMKAPTQDQLSDASIRAREKVMKQYNRVVKKLEPLEAKLITALNQAKAAAPAMLEALPYLGLDDQQIVALRALFTDIQNAEDNQSVANAIFNAMKPRARHLSTGARH